MMKRTYGVRALWQSVMSAVIAGITFVVASFSAVFLDAFREKGERYVAPGHDGRRQPDIAHRLSALFQDAGLLNVRVVPLAVSPRAAFRCA